MSAPAVAPLHAPEDSEARRRALDPSGSFIVQAPAGSGKTTLLVRRFLALLEQVEQPEAIVAITFTRKAAAEMRARVVAALDKAPTVLDRDREFGWNLRSNPSRLRIQTIDSLCASIVQRMPWMARTGGMPGIVEDARELYREAAQHTLAHVTQAGPAGHAAARLLLHLDNNYRVAQAMFEAQLARRDQWLRHVGIGVSGPSLRAALEAALAAVVTQGIEKAAERVPPLVLARLVALGNLKGVPAATSDDLPLWRALADLLLTSNGTWRRTVDARHGFPPNRKAEKQEFLDIVSALSGDEAMLTALVDVRKLPDACFAEEQWQLLEALLTLLPISAAELKVTFRERGVVDFVELGEAARTALGPADRPSDLALSLGERIQHLLIDEFQDTSVSQFELVQRLVAGWDGTEGRTLFLVGDPMQSIYRFREAEVGLFLRARKEGVGAMPCEPLQLTSNFRSRPAIIEWVNAAFSGIFPQSEDATLGAVTYASSSASRPATPDSAVTMAAYFSPEDRPEAEEVARLAEAALAAGTVAVLVRARSHATGIVAEFIRRKIPFRAVEFDPLAERQVIQDLQALTRALLHPADRTAWLAVLRAPWCGLTLADLHDLAAPDPRAVLWDRLQSSTLPRVQRLRDALAGPLAQIRRAPLRQCIESAWLKLGGQPGPDAIRFFDLLDEIDAGGETGFSLLERRIAQLFSLPQAGDGPAVDLMTIHKAKGLEWDTVILPGLGREAAADAKPLLRWSEVPMPDGSTRLVLAPIEATREEEDDPIFAYLARMERQRARYETARLLYVAATRAREKLHLLGHAEPNAKGEAKPRSGTLLHLLWPVVQDDFALAPPPGLGEIAPEPLAQTIRRVPDDWQPPQDVPEPGWQPRDVDETAVTFDWAGDTLRHAGTVTHTWLERIARDRLSTPPPRNVIRGALEALGLSGDDSAEAAEIVDQALSRTLNDSLGRWLLYPHADSATELKVSIVDEGVIRHCSIDRTFVDERGTRWVVDYKTGTHEGADVDDFLDRERERYRARMNLYARYFRAVEDRPTRLALYYPLLSGWREWQPD